MIADRPVQCICAYFGIPPERLLGRGRTRTIVFPRQIASYILHKHTSLRWCDIAIILGYGTHAGPYAAWRLIDGAESVGDPTVVQAIRAIGSMIESVSSVPQYKTVEVAGSFVEVKYEQDCDCITILDFKCDTIMSLLANVGEGKIVDKLIKALKE